MSDDQLFRLILLAGFVLFMPVGIYHRLKARTGEKLDRRQEGLFILITLRLTGLAGTAGSGSTRHYSHFTDVIPDVIDARVFGGLHFRTADVHGAMLGKSVADYVDAHFFNCGNAGQCKKEERE